MNLQRVKENLTNAMTVLQKNYQNVEIEELSFYFNEIAEILKKMVKIVDDKIKEREVD